MYKIIQLLISLLLIGIPLVGCADNAIPSELHKLFFDKSRFANPVSIKYPADHCDLYHRLKKKFSESTGGLEHVGIGVTVRPREINGINKNWFRLLEKNKYVELRPLVQKTMFGDKKKSFVCLTEKGKSLPDYV